MDYSGPGQKSVDAGSEPKIRRFTEPLKFLPLLLVAAIIVGLYAIYTVFHLLPVLQLEVPVAKRDQVTENRGFAHAIAFNSITFVVLVCYVRSVLTHPGQIPENDPNWAFQPQDLRAAGKDKDKEKEKDKDTNLPMLQEQKRSGERRHCKWCGKYKPDRCHHCRVCRMCILKMDHHCPWLYNCVGFKNHKFFFLLLLYSAIDTHFITWTMFESVRGALDPSTPFLKMFLLLFGETLSGLIAMAATMFFIFHIWLMLRAMTTIEFCEKSVKRVQQSHSFDRGVMGNLRAVLGPNMLLWLLPCSRPEGDGLGFITERTPLATVLSKPSPVTQQREPPSLHRLA
jgi:hypothetical protein